MGLELTVVKTPSDVDLSDFYMIKEIVEDKFDWYLGDDKDKRMLNYGGKYIAAMNLTRDKILEKATEQQKTVLEKLEPKKCEEYISILLSTVGEYLEGNTHLFFQDDKLPWKDIATSCNRILCSILEYDCSLSKVKHSGNEDYIIELDIEKVRKTIKEWKSKSWKMTLAKWVGFFYPEAGYRIMGDLFDGRWIWYDIYDVIWCKNHLSLMEKELNDGYRYWLLKSW